MIPVILPKVQAAGYIETHMHPTYAASNKLHCKLVHGCMVYTEPAPRRQQFHVAPANKKTAL